MVKIALITLLDEKFLPGFIAFWNSFSFFNKWFNFPFIILNGGLQEENKEFIKNKYPLIEIREIKKESYEKIRFGATPERLKKAYWKFEIFNQIDFDRLIFIDMDCLILGDLSELFKQEKPVSAVKTFRGDSLGKDINSGIMVLNKPVISEDVYRQLIALAERGFSLADQPTINHLFLNKINFLDKRFNVEKRLFKSLKPEFKKILKEARILHFVGEKPWDEKKEESEKFFAPLEKIWWNWYFNEERN